MQTMKKRMIVRLTGERSFKPILINGKAKPHERMVIIIINRNFHFDELLELPDKLPDLLSIFPNIYLRE